MQPEKLAAIRLSRFEREHLRLLTPMAKEERLLGPGVAAVLERGSKIEMEASIGSASPTNAIGVDRSPDKAAIAEDLGPGWSG